jgi:hypothetical protein
MFYDFTHLAELVFLLFHHRIVFGSTLDDLYFVLQILAPLTILRPSVLLKPDMVGDQVSGFNGAAIWDRRLADQALHCRELGAGRRGWLRRVGPSRGLGITHGVEPTLASRRSV